MIKVIKDRTGVHYSINNQDIPKEIQKLQKDLLCSKWKIKGILGMILLAIFVIILWGWLFTFNMQEQELTVFEKGFNITIVSCITVFLVLLVVLPFIAEIKRHKRVQKILDQLYELSKEKEV